jgi:nicotinamidase/pyrazinamidase
MRTVFIDVDTQFDFLYPVGALYVPGAEHVVPAIERLNRHAAVQGIPVLSTTDAHAEEDPEFEAWPPHCIAGTHGQEKPAATLLENRVKIPNRSGSFSLEGVQQVLLEKQSLDPFETVTLQRVLETLAADRFVVYGVVTEICVLLAARGLLGLKKRVAVVSDAIRELKADQAATALEEIRASGGTITTLREVLSS